MKKISPPHHGKQTKKRGEAPRNTNPNPKFTASLGQSAASATRKDGASAARRCQSDGWRVSNRGGRCILFHSRRAAAGCGWIGRVLYGTRTRVLVGGWIPVWLDPQHQIQQRTSPNVTRINKLYGTPTAKVLGEKFCLEPLKISSSLIP